MSWIRVDPWSEPSGTVRGVKSRNAVPNSILPMTVELRIDYVHFQNVLLLGPAVADSDPRVADLLRVLLLDVVKRGRIMIYRFAHVGDEKFKIELAADVRHIDS